MGTNVSVARSTSVASKLASIRYCAVCTHDPTSRQQPTLGGKLEAISINRRSSRSKPLRTPQEDRKPKPQPLTNVDLKLDLSNTICTWRAAAATTGKGCEVRPARQRATTMTSRAREARGNHRQSEASPTPPWADPIPSHWSQSSGSWRRRVLPGIARTLPRRKSGFP